ncbi:uncharacterized protein BN903_37 [Halorubrum sp. AJ67]|nr:uncharacterized protein BN903_21 [Halorubrum sp. AJ67]CDK40031.1 uncharacterized protein BN903_37 [Halorubrum sp. AJ67]
MFSLLRGCLRCSQRISDPCYSGFDAIRTDSSYGVVTLFHAPFQETSDELSRFGCQPEHHIGPKDLRFGLCRVYSRLLTTSRLRSFPALTEMFQFRAFPIARGNC